MKKVILGFAFIALAASVNAQDAASGPTFGVKAGVNLANLKAKSGDESESGDMKIGFHAGGFVNVPIGETFAFQPEVLFSTEGFKEEEDDEKMTLKLNYINVPLLLQYNASGFFAETGPQIGFNMSAKAKIESGGQDLEVDVKDEMGIKSTAFSWVVGLGYKTQSGFGFGARYNLGLSSIIDSEDDEDASLKSNVIQISLFKTFGK
jgi:hypothetical protein